MGNVRNYHFTSEVRAEYLTRLERGDGRQSAARALGLAPSTVARYVQQHPSFGEKIRAAEHTADGEVQRSLFERAKSGDTKAALGWLSARAPDVWQPTRTVRHGLADGPRERVVHEPFSALERLAVIEKLELTGARPVGSADAFRSFLIAAGELPAPAPAVLELVDVTEAEVVTEEREVG